MSKELDSLKHLHDIGLIDDKAFIDAVKRVTGGSPLVLPTGNKVTTPLRDGSDKFPFTSSPVKDAFTSADRSSTTPDKNKGILDAYQKWTDQGLKTRSPLTATYTAEQIDVVPYSENRSHLPQHAQDVLSWIDEAWDKTFKEYNDTKKDWERYEYEDADGTVKVEWLHKPSRRVDHDVKDLMEMFNLEVDPDNQP